MALHAFLRAHSILCSPPDPSSAGVDVIELRGGSDVKAVQTLLDRWG